MNLRTDLALERREIIEETEPEGIKSETSKSGGKRNQIWPSN